MWTPFTMLIGLAGLNAIPPYIYEAAAIDRASSWRVFRRLTLPLCAPLLGLAALLRATDALKQFDLVMAITGPNDASTQTLSALLYQVMFRDGKVGLGTAYSYVVLVLVIALASVFLRHLERLRQQGEA
jgi:multiple sugar transport system permease protein